MMPSASGKRNRQYTDNYKVTAVTLLRANDFPNKWGALKATAKQLGINEATLRGWARRGVRYGNPDTAAEVEVLMEEKRLEIKDLIEQALRDAIDALPGKIDDAPYKDVSFTVAVLTDKYLILNDKPTQNIQQGISFSRSGISTLPEQLAPLAIESTEREETL
jgi:transposase-like protein